MKQFALGAAVMASCPLSAQDGSEQTAERTPAGAVAFLNEFLPANGAEANVLVHFPNAYSGSDRKRWQDWRMADAGNVTNTATSWSTADFVGVEATNPCVTTFVMRNLHKRGTTGGRYDPYDLLVSSPGQTLRATIEWSKVAYLTASEIRVDSPTGKPFSIQPWNPKDQDWMTFGLSFSFATVEDEKRARFAMEFLRAACVPKSTTGF